MQSRGRTRVGARRSCPPSPPSSPRTSTASWPTSTGWWCPGVTHWQHPGWHAYFPTGASGPSVLADLVSSGLGVQGMLWSTSPACTELETHVLDWMAELLGLPERFRSDGDGGGVIEESASGATLCALLAARWRAAGDGPFDHLRALHVHAGPQLDREGRAHRRSAARPAAPDRGRRPTSRCGPTRLAPRDGRGPRRRARRRSSSSPTSAPPRRPPSIRCPPIADACAEHGAWLHVDAAHAGSRARVPRAAVDRRRRRAGRQLLHEPAQVAVHQLRLRLLLGGRPDRR